MKKVIKEIVKKYKWVFFIEIMLIMINIYVLTIPPKIIGSIIDLLYDISGNYEEIKFFTFLLLGVSFLLLFIRLVWKYLETFGQRGVEKVIKDRLFSHVLKLRLDKLQKIKNGELMSYFVKDISEIRTATHRIFSYGSRIFFTGIFATYAMITNVDLRLTIYTLIPILFTAFAIIQIRKYIDKSFRKAQKQFTQLSEYIQESTDAIRTTKAYIQEEQQLKEFIRKNKKLKGSNNAVDVHSTLLTSCINIGFGMCYAISILYGSKLVIQNEITIGTFVAFNSYIGMFINPVTWLPTVIARIKRGQLAYRRLDKVFAIEKEKTKIGRKENNKDKLNGNIEIKNLTFQYPQSLDKVLENVTIEIGKGQTLGIIGELGSGKTTLMNLLLRLYQVEENKILIDGIDINHIPMEVVRDNICYITQDNFLFSDTLKENIRLFKDKYEEKEIENSTKNAVIYEEVMGMPKKLNTVIGERGTDLSGGQKQRLVISRAFLRKSSIVIFDDTFSALDNHTEQMLLKNIKELAKEKTCIMISNRISDIKHSDKIILLENGKIVEQGNHDTLIQEKGRYYNFYKQQAVKIEGSLLA